MANKGMKTNNQALALVAQDLGVTVLEMLEQATQSQIYPGFCKGCDTVVLEGCDQDAGDNHCENCDAGTVEGVLLMAGMV